MNKIRIIAFKVNRACSRIGAVVDTWWPRDDDDRVRAIFDHKNFFQLRCYSGAVLPPESEYRSQICHFES